MARCASCGRSFDPDVEERKYDDDSYIQNHNLEGCYGNFINYCARCAISETMDSYSQGMEDFSYLDDDD